ncbi:hypothetical protein HY633_00685 [Candidatus Uhrbacteria bacterium]|nr:hypothetical protein [Candidatus Uhrbacteria bacterium]
MSRSHRSWLFTEFAVLGGFVMVAFIGYFVAIGSVLWPSFLESAPQQVQVEASPPAPSVEEYRASVANVAGPLLSQVRLLTDADLAAKGEVAVSLSSLVGKTQERLLRVTVPNVERDTHLSLVLLLEQWKRALAGSKADGKVVRANTAKMIAAHPWLLP